MDFNKTGIEISDLTTLIQAESPIVNFLLDIQNEWRIRRALNEDPNDQLLIGTRNIDEIIERIKSLESFRLQMMEEIKRKKEE